MKYKTYKNRLQGIKVTFSVAWNGVLFLMYNYENLLL